MDIISSESIYLLPIYNDNRLMNNKNFENMTKKKKLYNLKKTRTL